MNQTKIEYVDSTWNPVTGCTPISEGCEHCYAQRMAQRLRGRAGYPADDPFRVMVHQDRLMEPTKWKKPRRVLVCSMGDLFHQDAIGGFPYKVFKTMIDCPQHTFLILTKRPKRMATCVQFFVNLSPGLSNIPPNIWPGVTVELPEYQWRIKELLKIPAAVHWISIEPMLGSMDLAGDDGGQCYFPFENEQGGITPGLSWVVLGAETGSGARPMHPDWPRKVRDDCQAAGTPFFFKGWGEWKPITNDYESLVNYGGIQNTREVILNLDGFNCFGYEALIDETSWLMGRVGRKAAGRLLDGREWNEIPGEKP